MRSVRMLLKGKVQAVGYRMHIKRAAQKLEIMGFVKNLTDGDVEVVGQGSDDDVHSFIREVKRGPFSARVSSFSEDDLNSEEEYSSFEIRY